MTSNVWLSPAKLNLFLHINNRRQDGYHELQSLFQMLNYGDEMQFDITQDGVINLTPQLSGVANEDNLIIKAARLLQQKAGTTLGANILLNKNLPMGGGIGGGSSNAATTLLALNHLWQTNLSIKQLAELGLSLGADVPIFVHGRTAFAEGVGEKITAVDLPNRYYLVAVPDEHVSTGAVFQHPNLPRSTPKIRWEDYKFEKTHNDCQELVCELYPNIAKTLQWLLEYAPSRLTGTGACVFSVFEHEKEALFAFKNLPEGLNGFVCKGVNQSAVHRHLSGMS
jgi:4-diphosphocytidyl-2-C-methyl-D-erythritol kinase